MPVIPGDVLDRYPLIRLSHVFSLAFTQTKCGGFERELADLEALARRLASDPEADRAAVQELQCALPLQRIMWDGLRDNATNLRSQAEAWLAAWPDARARYRGDAQRRRLRLQDGRRHRCRPRVLRACRGRCRKATTASSASSWSKVLRALLLLKRGDFRAALAVAEAGLASHRASIFTATRSIRVSAGRACGRAVRVRRRRRRQPGARGESRMRWMTAASPTSCC